MKKHPLLKRLALAVFAVSLLGAMGLVVARSGPLAPARITVHQAAAGPVEAALFGIGTVEARRSYLIGPTAAGRVQRVAVDVGDQVKAGQFLAGMDPVDIDQRLAALDASIARARSTAAAMEAQRKDASARRGLAATNARRYTDLGQREFISASAVEAKLQEQVSAEAALSAAEANHSASLEDMKRLAAERAALREQHDNLRLVAPVNGLVISRDAEAGSTVVAGQPVLKLIDPASVWVKVRFDQGRSGGLAPGLAATVTLRSNPAQPVAGRVSRVEAVSDSVTEERVAHVAFDSMPQGISIGELAEVRVILPVAKEAIVVPNASLRHHGDSVGVWLLAGDGLRFAPVRIGQRGLDGAVQVIEGLQPGDRVVVHSEKELAGDTRVRVVDAIAGSRP